MLKFIRYIETEKCKKERPVLFWAFQFAGTASFFLFVVLSFVFAGALQ